MKTIIAHRSILVAVALAAAACQTLPGTEGTQQPAAPQITEDSLRARAQQQLADGVKQYDAGDYDNAIKNLSNSLEHGMLSKAEQARARKYIAFSQCVSGREILCRDEFRKAFEIYPDFALSPAEDGHPIWGPVYRSVRTQLIAEREAQRPKSLIPLGKAEQMMQDGMVKYDAGEYPQARALLEGALKEGLSTKENKTRTIKTIAFSLCLENKYRDCRAEFLKIYDIDPDFDLTPAEAGHPSWTHTFASVKAQAHKAMKEKAEREARENKSKGPPPTAGTKQ